MASAKIQATEKLELPDDPVQALRLLAARYTFTPSVDARIDQLLGRIDSYEFHLSDPPAPEPQMTLRKSEHVIETTRAPAPETPQAPMPDPLINPPTFIRREQLSMRSAGGRRVVEFGDVHGYNASLVYADGEVMFRWGCRSIMSEDAARQHWRGGVSRYSGDLRPKADELINFVVAICRFRGWRW